MTETQEYENHDPIIQNFIDDKRTIITNQMKQMILHQYNKERKWYCCASNKMVCSVHDLLNLVPILRDKIYKLSHEELKVRYHGSLFEDAAYHINSYLQSDPSMSNIEVVLHKRINKMKTITIDEKVRHVSDSNGSYSKYKLLHHKTLYSDDTISHQHDSYTKKIKMNPMKIYTITHAYQFHCVHSCIFRIQKKS